MARIKIEEIVDHLSYDMKRALEAALEEVMPNASIDRTDLHKAFVRAVRRKCSTWVDVPDRYVD